MSPERESEPDDPLEPDMDFIVEELCDYMSQLDQPGPKPQVHSSAHEFSSQLQSTMLECRSILDFLHETRSQNFTSTADLAPEGSFGGFPTPSQIGRFKILKRLGFGGYGVVFQGRDPDGNRDVAIKIPRPELLDSPELLHRFAREGSIVSQLNHPNIVSILECDTYGVVPYIVMEYLPGATLSEWRETQPQVSPRAAAEIVRDLARGVAHAHQRGVLHRDIKPGNVILTSRHAGGAVTGYSFTPVLTDFGVAQCAGLNTTQTQSGAMIGTMRYMSPEQVEGKIHEITQRTDVYGLGTILYELLSGHAPFESHNYQKLLSDVLHVNPTPLCKSRPDLPTSIALICSKCMEKSPDHRYSSVEELANDLQRYLNGEPISVRPLTFWRKNLQLIFQYPVRTLFIVLTFAGLSTMTAVALMVNARLTELLDIADSERAIARRNESLVRHRAYCSDMRNAKRSFGRGNVRLMLQLLGRYRPNTSLEELRDFAWFHLHRQYTDASLIMGHHKHGATSVAVSRRGDMVASGGEDSMINLWSMPSRQLIKKFQAHEFGSVESLNFSRDGTHLASTGADGTVRVWDTASMTELFVCRGHQSPISDVIYSPRGDYLISAGTDGTVRLWQSKTGDSVATLHGHAGPVFCLAAHPTQNIFASGSEDSTIRLWDLDEIGPDSRLSDGALHVPEPRSRLRSLCFEPDGQSLVAGLAKAETLRFSMQPDNFGALIELQATPANCLSLAWPKSGPVVMALGNAEIRVADPLQPGSEFERLRGHLGPVVSISTPEDGSYLVSASDDGDIRFWSDFQRQSRIVIEDENRSRSAVDPQRFSAYWQGSTLAADLQNGKLLIYRMPEGKFERSIEKRNTDNVVLSPSGRCLLLHQLDGTVIYHDIDQDQVKWQQQFAAGRPDRPPDACAIDATNSRAAIVAAKELLIVSTENGEIWRRLEHPKDVLRGLFAELQPSRSIVVTTCSDGYVRTWDLHTGKQIYDREIGFNACFAIAVTPDNQFLAATVGGSNAVVQVLRLHDLSNVATLPISASRRGSGFIVNRVAFLDDLRLLVQANSEFILWNVKEETEICMFPELEQSGAFAVGPDHQQVAVPSLGHIHLIDGRRD